MLIEPAQAQRNGLLQGMLDDQVGAEIVTWTQTCKNIFASMRLQHRSYGIVHYSVASDYDSIRYGIASSTSSYNHSCVYSCMYILSVRMIVMYLGI